MLISGTVTAEMLPFLLPSSSPFLPPSLGKTYGRFALFGYRVNPKKSPYSDIRYVLQQRIGYQKKCNRDGARTRDFEIALLGVTYDSHPHHPHSIEVHNSIDP